MKNTVKLLIAMVLALVLGVITSITKSPVLLNLAKWIELTDTICKRQFCLTKARTIHAQKDCLSFLQKNFEILLKKLAPVVLYRGDLFQRVK